MEVADQTSKKMTVQSYRGLRITFKQWISFILAVATMEIHFSRRVIMQEEPSDFPVGCQIARNTSVLPRKKERNLAFDPMDHAGKVVMDFKIYTISALWSWTAKIIYICTIISEIWEEILQRIPICNCLFVFAVQHRTLMICYSNHM
jgi:hypothetical protein